MSSLIDITLSHARFIRARPVHYDHAMSRYRRALTGSTYFFTLIAYRRRPILCDDAILSALRDAIIAVRTRRPFMIDAWVQLPDHLHCIWTLPPDDHDFARRWSEIKHRVSYNCRHLYDDIPVSRSMQRQRAAAIWQRRFWEHQIRDERDFSAHMDYVHINPVKHGYVAHASLWPHSSFTRCVRDGMYPPDWGGPVNDLIVEWD